MCTAALITSCRNDLFSELDLPCSDAGHLLDSLQRQCSSIGYFKFSVNDTRSTIAFPRSKKLCPTTAIIHGSRLRCPAFRFLVLLLIVFHDTDVPVTLHARLLDVLDIFNSLFAKLLF